MTSSSVDTGSPARWSVPRLAGWQSGLSYGAFALAALTTVVAAGSIFSGLALSDEARLAWTWVLGVNSALILALCVTVAVRVARLARARARDEATLRLHLRFAGFLSLAAILPAVIVAAFFGAVFLQLFDTWFSDRMGGVLENVAGVARDYVDDRARDMGEPLGLMAFDLNNPEAAAALRAEPITYKEYLRDQTRVRGFEAAYVIDRTGTVLAFAEFSGDGGYLVPSQNDYDAADAGAVDVKVGGLDDPRIRALIRLESYDNAYLYAIQRLPEEVVGKLASANQALADFRDASGDQDRLQGFIGMIYAQMTLLVVAGAASLGLAGATRLVAPIGRLVRAAERVGAGDLTARVPLDHRRDEVSALAHTFNDMTAQLARQRDELVSAREVAEARQELTEAVLAGVSAGVISVDARDRVAMANASAVTLLDVDGPDALTGRNIAAAAPEFAALTRAAKGMRDPLEAQIQLERKGRVRHLNVRAGIPGDGSGSVVITFDDTTRLVSAQRNAAWRDVARRIAHEIKNPLTPIQLSAERLARKYRARVGEDVDVFDRCTETILSKVGDIGRMVDEFSAFARMPAPRVAPVLLAPLVRDAVFAQRVATPSIRFEFLADEREIVAACDGRLFSQALANVLKNAAESVGARAASNPGGKAYEGEVVVRLDADDLHAAVEVRDNGLGWPTPELERVMEPYFTTREKGTGLGLAIVKRVMEDHAGRLELKDRLDGETGAVVRLVLPLHAQDAVLEEMAGVQDARR